MMKKKIKNEPYSSKRYAGEDKEKYEWPETAAESEKITPSEPSKSIDELAGVEFFDGGDDEEQYVVPKAVSAGVPRNNAAAYQRAEREEQRQRLIPQDDSEYSDEPEEEIPQLSRPQNKRLRKVEPEPVYQPEEHDGYDDDFDEYDEYDKEYMPMWKIILITFLITVFCSGVIMFFANGGIAPIMNRVHESRQNAAPTPMPTKLPVVEYTSIIPFEDASGAQYSAYKSGIIAASSNSMYCFGVRGEELWKINTLVVEPILKSAGDYILLAENGGKKLSLYTGDRMVYSNETDGNIRYANLSSNGDVVVVTDKDAYKGAVVAYNKAGDKIFEWFSGTDPIMAAAISPRSRRIAVGLINTDDKVKSSVMLFNINETESYAQENFENTAVFDLQYKNDKLNIMGDNMTAIMSTSGRVVWKAEYYEGEFSHYAIDSDGNTLALVDESNVPVIYYYNEKGKTEYSLKLGELPDFVDVYSKTIIYNNGRDIIIAGNNNRTSKSYTATMDVKKLCLINEKAALIVYNNSLEFIGL